MKPLPMFPLGVALFPGGYLPLQVFEPRYRKLVADLPEHDNRFGVVLIKRGQEVGGGEERYDIGTVAEVVAQEEVGDGYFLLSTVGRERIRVTEWLADDPYPRALVERLMSDGDPADVGAAIEKAANARKQVLGMAVEMGADGRYLDVELPEDQEQAAWVLCDASPIGAFDRQQLLEIDDPVLRLGTLEDMLSARAEDLRQAMRR
jgi:Lon protease-like protein